MLIDGVGWAAMLLRGRVRARWSSSPAVPKGSLARLDGYVSPAVRSSTQDRELDATDGTTRHDTAVYQRWHGLAPAERSACGLGVAYMRADAALEERHHQSREDWHEIVAGR